MTHEYIYNGDSRVGVRLIDKADELHPMLDSLDNNPATQMRIRMAALSIGADTPGVWDWRSVGTDDTDVYIYWDPDA